MLKARRKELDLSQQQVADMVGLSRGRIAQYEGGDEIPEDVATALAKALKLNKTDLQTNLRPVRTKADLKAWKRLVFEANHKSDVLQVTLVWMADFLLDERDNTYFGSIERLAANVPGVEYAELVDAWDEILESGFVRNRQDAEWALDLTFPPGH